MSFFDRPMKNVIEYQNLSKDMKEIDNILDYVWCRLSEKYVKISRAFRNMDITIVFLYFIQHENLSLININTNKLITTTIIERKNKLPRIQIRTLKSPHPTE